MKIRSLLGLSLAAAALSAGPGTAQFGPAASPDTTRGLSEGSGLSVGFHLTGRGTTSAGNPSRSVPAAGTGLTLRYGTSDAVSFFARGDVGYQSGQLDLGVRYRFSGPTSALRPYVEGGVSHLRTTQHTGSIDATPFDANPANVNAGYESSRLRSSANTLTVAAGVEYAVSRRLSLDLGLSASHGRLTPTEARGRAVGPGRAFVRPRLQFGVSWRP